MILRAVVLEYVHGAEPVASELIGAKYELGVSSATIRNELAEMSQMGFLDKPHTSAGRIPSDKGYRYYVDFIRPEADPDKEQKGKVKDAAGEGDALQGVLRDTTRLLSRLTLLLSAATVSRNAAVKAKHAVVTVLGPESALLILVLSNGHIENRMFELTPRTTIESIGQLNEAVKMEVEGKSLTALSNLRVSPGSERMLGAALATIRGIARELTKGVIIAEGQELLLNQPEFKRDLSLMDSLLSTLDNQDGLYRNLSDGPETVTIGSENSDAKMQQFTVIRRAFYVGETEAGTLAIIGPTRMNYDRAISLVDFTAKAVSDSLTKILK